MPSALINYVDTSLSYTTVTAHGAPVVAGSPGMQEVVGSIPSWVIPKILVDNHSISQWID